MNFVDMWVQKEFDGSYTEALEFVIVESKLTGDKMWIPYLETILERLEEMMEDQGAGSAKMLGIIMLGTIAFWIAFLYYVFIA